MEVALLEDPACSWCWAFQPVETAFVFEYGHRLKLRRVMGGLRDYPIAGGGFVLRQWKLAEEVSGMPFDAGVWSRHALQTTFVACRAVKAAQMTHSELAVHFLRRLREAFHLECFPIDDLEKILPLAAEVGLDIDRLQDHISSGRADTFFEKDRDEASRHGFGFPTIVIRAPNEDTPTLLQGVVPYNNLTRALDRLGFPPKRRRRFHDRAEDWERIFRIRRRCTLPELLRVTRMKREPLESRLRNIGAVRQGPFYALEREVAKPSRPPPAMEVAAH